MKKYIFKKVVAFGSPLFLAVPFLTTSSISLKNDHNESANKDNDQENRIISYDNKIFNSKNQLLKYYLRTHPDAISSKNVIGNVDNAMIDYDDGILNQHKLYDYDLNKIEPVYRKSNGEKTSSFEDAKASYANVVMIKKKFQGVTILFDDENEAKNQRDNLIKPINMVYYDNVPNPLKGEQNLKINPLNEKDVLAYQQKFLNILTNKNYKRVNSNYRRSFEFDTSEMDNDLKSLFEKTDKPLYFINKFHDAVEEVVKDDGEFGGVKEDKGQDISHWINRKSIPNGTDEAKRAGDKNKLDMDDTVDNISLSLFDNKIKFENNFKFYKYTKMARNDDFDGYTNVSLKNKDDLISISPPLKHEEINGLINGENFQGWGNILASGKNHNWNIDASSNDYFKKFMKVGSNSLKKMKKLFGNQFDAFIKVELIKENDNSFEGIHVVLDDVYDANDNNNDFWIDGINLNKFKFSWRFKLKTSLFKNLIPNLVKKIEGEDNFWMDTLYKRVLSFFPSNLKEINGVKNIQEDDVLFLNNFLKDDNIKNIFSQTKEYINFYNFENQSTKKIFLVNRNKPEEKVEIESVFKNIDFESLVNDKILENVKKEYTLKILMDYLLQREDFSLEKLKKLIKEIVSDNFTYEEGLTDLTGDQKTPIDLSQDHILPTFIQQVVNHIKAIKSELNNSDYLKDNVFLKRTIINFKNSNVSPLLFGNEIKGFKFPFTIKNGAYLLISDALFNGSIINRAGDGNINQDGILDTQQELENNKKIILSSRPPVVRVMYNLNGDIILGNKDPEKPLLYDSQSMVVQEAKAIATPLRDHKYIFYQNKNNQEIIILNQISNIYVLKYKKIMHYFLSHENLIKYLEHKLLEDNNLYSIT